MIQLYTPSALSSMQDEMAIPTKLISHVELPTKRQVPYNVYIEPQTSPLHVLKNKRVLVLADVENIRYSAKNLGFRFSFGALKKILATVCEIEACHAFFSAPIPANTHEQYFEKRGWKAHVHPIETVQTYRGLKKRANSDNLILFKSGLLVSRSQADTILIASGDGDLVTDLARAILMLPKIRQVITLSLPASTSYRLDATVSPYIEENMEIGADCLCPL